MEKFFKVRVSYKKLDPQTEKLVNKKADFVIEGVNYQDVEITTIKLIDYFHLNAHEECSYDISKMQIRVLILDKNSTNIEVGEGGEGVDELNGLCFVSQIVGDFEPDDIDFGLYHITIVYEDLESKIKRERIHIVTRSISDANTQARRYITKYLGGGVVTNIKLEAQSSLLTSNETTNAAKEFYDIIN